MEVTARRGDRAEVTETDDRAGIRVRGSGFVARGCFRRRNGLWRKRWEGRSKRGAWRGQRASSRASGRMVGSGPSCEAAATVYGLGVAFCFWRPARAVGSYRPTVWGAVLILLRRA